MCVDSNVAHEQYILSRDMLFFNVKRTLSHNPLNQKQNCLKISADFEH